MSNTRNSRNILWLREAIAEYDSRRFILGPVSMSVETGQFWGVLGPNGAGKSTLLKLMAGLLTPTSGSVVLMDRPLGEWALRERARHLTYLPQNIPTDLDMTAQEIVLLGRHPYRGLSFFESRDDFAAVGKAMEAMDAAPLASRRLRELSGGEAQRVHLAACLAQQAALMILDEPTTSLDIRHQHELLHRVRRHVDDRAGAVVAAIHDINLARQWCTHVLLLCAGRIVAQGTPANVLTRSNLEHVFCVPFVVAATCDARREWVVADPRP